MIKQQKINAVQMLMWTCGLLGSISMIYYLTINRLWDYIDIFAFFGSVSLALMIYSANQIKEESNNFALRLSKKRLQEQIIFSIEYYRREIRQAAEGHLEELSKNKIPSYFIPSFNALDFISRINPKVNGKDTWMLKQLLIKIQNKIENINRLVELAQNADTFEKKSKKYLINELNSNTYYKDLIGLILNEPLWKDFEFILNKA